MARTTKITKPTKKPVRKPRAQVDETSIEIPLGKMIADLREHFAARDGQHNAANAGQAKAEQQNPKQAPPTAGLTAELLEKWSYEVRSQISQVITSIAGANPVEAHHTRAIAVDESASGLRQQMRRTCANLEVSLEALSYLRQVIG